MSLGLSALALAAPASAQTTFVQLGLPYGIVTDANGNVFVTHDGTSTTFLTKFSPSGEEIDTISIGGITVGQIGRLAMDPATGEIWNLSIEGDLRIVDPDTLDVQPLSNLRGVDLSATSTHVWNAALEGFFSQVDYFQPSVSTFGDIALYRSQNNARLDAFITARHIAKFPYASGSHGSTTSTWSDSPDVPLPNPGERAPRNRGSPIGSGGHDTAAARPTWRRANGPGDLVPANFPEQGVPRVELDKWDESSRDIGTHAAGNFYLTSQINSSLCGVNAGAAIMVLSPQVEFRACHPRSLLAAGEDVAGTASGDHVYSTIQSQLYLGAENAVVDWGRAGARGRVPRAAGRR